MLCKYDDECGRQASRKRVLESPYKSDLDAVELDLQQLHPLAKHLQSQTRKDKFCPNRLRHSQILSHVQIPPDCRLVSLGRCCPVPT